MARQPIFNRNRQVVAYELLYRNNPVNSISGTLSEQTTLSMLERILNTFDFQRVTQGLPGFFNISRELLLRGHWQLLPPERTVLEILETITPDPEVVEAFRKACQMGYRIALDDFVWSESWEPLVGLAAYLKIDIQATSRRDRAAAVSRFSPGGVTMLAEKVETWEEYNECQADGYDLLQGYFFRFPEIISTHQIPPGKLQLARLIAELSRPDLSLERLEALISSDVALSVKLLRYLRSAGFGWRHEIEGISQCLLVLGEEATRKWGALVALTMIGAESPPELLVTSLTRARFLEILSSSITEQPTRDNFFMTGLLSLLDALMEQPLEVILASMALNSSVKGALLGDDSPLSRSLVMVSAWERGDWARVDQLCQEVGLQAKDLQSAYLEATSWADELYQGAGLR